MYLESYMSRVLDIPKYRANKDKDKINLVYFIRFIHYKLVSYDNIDKQCLPHSSSEFKILNSPDECGKHCLSYETSL